MPNVGDLRGLDARTQLSGRTCGVGAETQLYDIQAQVRRALLKKRDAGLDVMILLVAETSANRRVLAEHREMLRGSFPLDTRGVMRAVARGLAPPADGIVVL